MFAVEKMLASILSCMLTMTTTLTVYYQVFNPETIRISKVSPIELSFETYTPKIEYNIPRVTISYKATINPDELNCMAMNMFFEARNQKSDEAIAAVGYIVLNRMNHHRYPDTVCGVVYQGQKRSGEYVRNKCQFSWVCDGKPPVVNMDNAIESQAWDRVHNIAKAVFHRSIENPIGKSTMYHATYVSPYWKKAYEPVAQVGDHVFYQKRI